MDRARTGSNLEAFPVPHVGSSLHWVVSDLGLSSWSVVSSSMMNSAPIESVITHEVDNQMGMMNLFDQFSSRQQFD